MEAMTPGKIRSWPTSSALWCTRFSQREPLSVGVTKHLQQFFVFEVPPSAYNVCSLEHLATFRSTCSIPPFRCLSPALRTREIGNILFRSFHFISLLLVFHFKRHWAKQKIPDVDDSSTYARDSCWSIPPQPFHWYFSPRMAQFYLLSWTKRTDNVSDILCLSFRVTISSLWSICFPSSSCEKIFRRNKHTCVPPEWRKSLKQDACTFVEYIPKKHSGDTTGR